MENSIKVGDFVLIRMQLDKNWSYDFKSTNNKIGVVRHINETHDGSLMFSVEIANLRVKNDYFIDELIKLEEHQIKTAEVLYGRRN